MTESIIEATSLLSSVKDIRDELNILRTIADFQLTVQSGLAADNSTNDNLISQYVLNDIKELDNVTKRIQEGVRHI